METTYKNMLLFSKRKMECFPPLMAYKLGATVAIPVRPVLPGNPMTMVGVGELAVGSKVRRFPEVRVVRRRSPVVRRWMFSINVASGKA